MGAGGRVGTSPKRCSTNHYSPSTPMVSKNVNGIGGRAKILNNFIHTDMLRIRYNSPQNFDHSEFGMILMKKYA